ncbi:FLYWCH zinc finger domain-containing protein [Phthorimaea operculella]|nr:FLYWCH zinc finger domain-containing protein [Phthorimaea operculella]
MARHLRTKHPNAYKKVHPFLDKNPIKGPLRSTSWIKGSWGRKYCSRITGHKYKCNMCDTVLSLSNGMFSNMKRHIKSKHPEVYEQEVGGGKSDEELSQAEYGSISEAREYVTEFIEELQKTEYLVDDPDLIVPEPDKSFLDENDPDFEAKVKYLVTKPVARKRARNCMWNFFNVIEENRLYSCLACNRRVYIFPHSFANMKRHMMTRHKHQYSLMRKYMKIYEENRNPSPVSFEKYYFEQDGDSEYKCKECDTTISSTGEDQLPLFEHIKEAHPNFILAFQEEDVANDDQDEDVANDDQDGDADNDGQEGGVDSNDQEEGDDKDDDEVNIVLVKEIDEQFVCSSRGNLQLLRNNYVYIKASSNAMNSYYCTRRTSNGCKGIIKLAQDGTIKQANEEHNHPPSKYVISPRGQYIKIE